MKQYINQCSVYILLWGIYYLQGTLYPTGGVISQGVLAFIMLMSIYYFVRVNIAYKLPSFLKVLNLFLAIMTIYGVVFMFDPTPIVFDNILSQKVNKLEYLKTLYMSLLPIYAMFYFVKKNILTESFIRIFTLFWLFIKIVGYIRYEQELQLLLLENGYADDVEITNNIAYEFVYLFPLLFLWGRKPLFQYMFTAVIFAFILSGMKRGAIIIGAVCLIWFLYMSIINSRGRQRSVIVFSTIILLAVGAYYVMDLYEASPYFQYRVKETLEGHSSGRDVIYSSLWQHYVDDMSLQHFLLGNGVFYTVNIAGNFAHNDWLELLINQGLLGVVIYVAYFITLLRSVYLSRKNNMTYGILSMIFVIMLASSIFSMSYSSLGLPIAVGLGYCLSKPLTQSAYEKNNLSY